MKNASKIILDYKQIPQLLRKYRDKKKKIVLTQGSFDMIHIGHGRYLQEAKKHGDVLFVGTDCDAKIKQRKGDDRPVVPEKERLEMLTYLTSVDHVVLKKNNRPKWELIKLIKPDVLIATKETYSPAQIKKLEKICGQVVVLDPMATTSTSAKIRLVQLKAAKKISSNLTHRLLTAIQEVVEEVNGSV